MNAGSDAAIVTGHIRIGAGAYRAGIVCLGWIDGDNKIEFFGLDDPSFRIGWSD
jgi:hypothetical protein